MALTIRFDRQTCAGFFSCVAVDPEDFEEDRARSKSTLVEGSARGDVHEKDVPAEARERVVEAAEVCPVDAIQVLDEAGNVLAGPASLRVEDHGESPSG